MKTKHHNKTIYLALAVLGLTCLPISPTVQAVTPAPDGGYPGGNTAEGHNALQSITTGGFNAAVGFFSLFANTTASFNTAVGAGALDLNTAADNTATGAAALLLNTTGADNTATGVDALALNDTGSQNTASGSTALFNNTTGDRNTAIGVLALQNNTTGSLNTALGRNAGGSVTGDGNVCIGEGVVGSAGVSDTTWIRNVFDSVATSRIVYVNADGKLGTLASSRRFKDEIKPMDKTSEALLALKPVTFCYKKDIDPAGTSQFGLVAEDVEKVNPDLVVRDKEGKAYSVRYDAVNAMLLNEFLKEHRKVEELEANAVRQQKQIEALTAGLQKVSAQLEVSKPAPQTVLNNQ